jgi:hypothetical protein
MDRVGAVVRAAKLEVRHRNKALHVGRGTKIIAVARCCVCRPADAVPAEESVPAAERRSPLERMFPPAEVAILGYITCATRLRSTYRSGGCPSGRFCPLRRKSAHSTLE